MVSNSYKMSIDSVWSSLRISNLFITNDVAFSIGLRCKMLLMNYIKSYRT
jgi:hypothetical protein